jgi:hypothetical protein
LVSASLFIGDKVRVQGFPWCKDNPKEIGISALTAKILCETHNNVLSPVDTAGAKAFSVFREMMRLTNVRGQMKPRVWNVVKYRINGRPLERWLLKTLINICCNGEYPIGRTSTVSGRPSEQLVRIAYGLESFEGLAGLHFVVRTGMKYYSDDTVSFSPLIKNGEHIEGGLFRFRGLLFLLFLEAEGPPVPLSGIYFEGEHVGDAQLNFHNREVSQTTGRFRSQVLTIDWENAT